MGQNEDFLKYYDDLSDAIFRYCYFRVYDSELARDLTQETFIKTWEYISSGKQIVSMKAFVYRVATNMIIDHSRRKKPLSLDELTDSQGFDVPVDHRDELRGKLDLEIMLRHLEKVEEKYREAVLMRYVEDLSPQEIAEITGESPNNISVRIHRGLQQLRLILEGRTKNGK